MGQFEMQRNFYSPCEQGGGVLHGPLLPKLPHIAPLKHPRYAWPMTIAAGFFYANGVLVSADTQVVCGVGKLDAQKTGRFTASWGNVIAAFGGNSDYASASLYECDHLKETARFKSDPVQAFREFFRKRYRADVFKHPSYSTGEFDYQLLVGIHLSAENRTRLYTMREGLFRPVTGFECFGYGEVFARDLCRFLYDYKMDHRRAVAIVSYVLAHTKVRANYTGGGTSIEILDASGAFLPSNEVEAVNAVSAHINNVSNWFMTECQQFLVRHVTNNEEAYKDLVGLFLGRIDRVRDLWKAIREGPSDPKSTKDDLSPLPPWPE